MNDYEKDAGGWVRGTHVYEHRDTGARFLSAEKHWEILRENLRRLRQYQGQEDTK